MKKYSIKFLQKVDDCKTNISYFKIINVLYEKEKYDGTELSELFNYIKGKAQITVSDLEYWGPFIITYLYKNKYKSDEDIEYLNKKYTFKTVIDDNNNWYKIIIKCKNGTLIFDNFKKKLGVDVRKFGRDMKIDDDENAIINYAIKMLDEQALDNTTIGSSCIKYFKSNCKYCHQFLAPVSKIEDDYIRESYFGGLCKQVNNKSYKGKITAIDMNSMYPYVLYKYPHPVGNGIYVKGKCKSNLHIQHFKVNLTLKRGCIPCLNQKNMFFDFEPIFFGEYELTLCSADIINMFNNYNVNEIEYIDGYEYKESEHIFNKYIDIWYYNKMEAKREKNDSLYFLSKLMLNNLGGKMATKKIFYKNNIQIDDEGKLYNNIVQVEGDGFYLPIAIFMCAYARMELINTAKILKKEIVYYDTDSLYFKGTLNDDDYNNIKIDDNKLGYWKVEGVYEEAVFIKQKTYYVRKTDGSEKFVVAGLNDTSKEELNKNNFKSGTELYVNNTKRIIGGNIKTKSKFKL